MTEAQLRSIEFDLESTFPDARGLSPIKLLGEGWGGTVFEGNNGIVFRIGKHHLAQEQNALLVKLLPAIQAGLTTVQIPIPEYFLDTSKEFPFGILGYIKIPGTTLTREQVLSNSRMLATEIAELLLAFHTLKLSKQFLKLEFPGSSDSVSELEALWSSTSSWVAEQVNAHEYKLIEQLWAKSIHFLANHPTQAVLAHGDPWYENLIVDENIHIVGVVDFEKVCIGDPAIDFALQKYVSTNFMHEVIQRYKDLGGKLGDHLELRIQISVQVKSLKDLANGIKISYIHESTLPGIRNAFQLDD